MFANTKALSIPQGNVVKIEVDGVTIWNVKKSLPSEYQEVEYIETTGTQYIDTGFTPNQDSRAICEFVYFDGSGICGARANVSSKNFSLRVASSKWQPRYGAESYNYADVAVNDEWHTVEFNKNLFYFDGVLVKEFTYTTFTAPKTFTLGGINANAGMYYGKEKCGKCKLYDNGILKRYIIPCYRKADGVIGMYDMVNNVFYVNAGSGVFLKGDDVGEMINQVPLSTEADGSVFNGVGYQDDMRVRSTGVVAEWAGAVATGFIPVKSGDRVRFTCTTWTNESNGNAINLGYISNGTFTSLGSYTTNTGSDYGEFATGSGGSWGTDYKAKEESTGVWILTVPPDDQITHIRMSCMGKGENLIVTVNQKIN